MRSFLRDGVNYESQINKEASVNKLGNGHWEAEKAADVVENELLASSRGWQRANPLRSASKHCFRGTKHTPRVSSLQSFGSVKYEPPNIQKDPWPNHP